MDIETLSSDVLEIKSSTGRLFHLTDRGGNLVLFENGTNFQQRVLDEKQELEVKRSKLLDFFDTDTFKALHEIDQTLLKEQFRSMKEYSQILTQRIARFK